jgi:hypothetical protein
MTAQTRPLIDLLPPGTYYDDREGEADLVEMLRTGWLGLQITEPMADYAPLLKARLGRSRLTYSDWAAFRYFLQEQAALFVRSLGLVDFTAAADALTSDLDDEAPDPAVLALGGGDDDDEDAPALASFTIPDGGSLASFAFLEGGDDDPHESE